MGKYIGHGQPIFSKDSWPSGKYGHQDCVCAEVEGSILCKGNFLIFFWMGPVLLLTIQSYYTTDYKCLHIISNILYPP